MKLAASDVQKLERFLERIAADTYPEPPNALHTDITRKMLDAFLREVPLSAGTRVLDVGCGQGVALEEFARHRFDAVGITLNAEDAAVCRARGYDVLEMDQSFLRFPDASFDLVWCRHCLEHSVVPYFTLVEFARVLRPAGYLYVEVPAPDTNCQHQSNKNHYSVLGKSMWTDLFARAGFALLQGLDIALTTPAGPDTYWAFVQQKS